MKRTAAIWLALASALWAESPPLPKSAKPAKPAAPPPAASLRWRNGETLPGELVEASAESAVWKSPLFEEPLVLAWSALQRVERALPASRPSEPFGAAMRDGSFIYGDLVSISDAAVSLRSARHGEVSLKRPEVASIRRLKGGKLLFGGPTGDAGWGRAPEDGSGRGRRVSSGVEPKVPQLTSGPGGALLMPYWNSSAFLDLAIPERVDFEFRVRSTDRPQFELWIAGGGKQNLHLETWDDELVLAAGAEFKSVRKLQETEREVSLRVCWDRKAAKCSVFTAAGAPVAEWQLSPDAVDPNPAKSGVTLMNKGRDLTLELLRVRQWDGNPPPQFDLQRQRVELADGRILTGEIATASEQGVELKAGGEEAAATFPLSEIEALVFSPEQPAAPQPEAGLSYSDGTLVSGALASVKDGRALIRASFSEQPFPASLDGLRQLSLPISNDKSVPAEPPLKELDKLALQQATLHGKAVGDGSGQLLWMPVGGVKAAALPKGAAAEITRALPANVEVQAAPALFYTGWGDVLPGALRGLDRTGVEIESSLIEASRLPADALNAIQFGAAAQRDFQGFDDPGWRVLKGGDKVKKTDASVTLDQDAALAHPSALQASELNFTIETTSFAVLRVRLFCAGTERGKSPCLMLGLMSNRLTYGIEASEGQLEDQSQMMVEMGKPVAVRLEILDKEIALHLNGALLRKYPIPAAKRAGNGLMLEAASLWGNSVNPIVVSKFSAVFTPGQMRLPEPGAEARLQALTVPRFRKDAPPRHALLAANGDVLRGEIEAVTATHFGFRSGLENLRVPRDRVAAAIWLKKPLGDAAAPAEAQSPTAKLLSQKIDSPTRRYSRIELRMVTQLLQQEVPGLKFKLPEQMDRRYVQFTLGGQTVSEALDQICGLFGMHYRVAEDGAIVIEGGPQTPKGMLRKTYWLKPGAFPAEGSVQEALAAKGVPFPAGARAAWQPDAAQLEVVNAEENQKKLLEVLASDFGGVLGSPTHWLALANGAQLGIEAERFEQDAVVGRHPVYGRCRAPMSQIYKICTSAPEPTAGIRSLADWRLVFAPEPVLPEAGGESGPLLGKEAKAFKLPLLAGGEFDLARQKGKVVVLDFWATWCGPCIKSLPGLISAMEAFPADKVQLIGVNQSEPAEQVKRFLDTRSWKLTVAMDAGQAVARQYGVDGIPHTVIVGPDGKVAWTKTGYSPDGAAEAAAAVKKLLEEPGAK